MTYYPVQIKIYCFVISNFPLKVIRDKARKVFIVKFSLPQEVSLGDEVAIIGRASINKKSIAEELVKMGMVFRPRIRIDVQHIILGDKITLSRSLEEGKFIFWEEQAFRDAVASLIEKN